MNHTNAICGHSVIAVGAPGSDARNEAERGLCEQCQEIVEQYANDIVNAALDRHKQEDPERLEKLLSENPGRIEQYRREHIINGKNLVLAIVNKPACYRKHLRGGFHPSNKHSRKAFAAITGIDLPYSVHGTDSAIRAYVGEVAAQEDSRLQKEREAELIEKLEQQKRNDELAFSAIRSSMLANTPIEGGQLLFAARQLNIDVHPRTAGLLRHRIHTINKDTARIHGRGNSGQAFKVYGECLKAIKENSPCWDRM